MSEFKFQRLKDTLVMTGVCTLSFPYLAEPRSFQGQAPKYQAGLIFPKTEDLTAVKLALQAAIQGKWGNTPPANLRVPIRDGAEKHKINEDGSKVFDEGYGPDVFFINTTAAADRPPQLLDAQNQPVNMADKAAVGSMFYGGCKVRAIINAFAYDKSGNRGVSFGLNAVQFAGKGQRFGGGVDAQQAFQPIETPDADGLANMFGGTPGGESSAGDSAGAGSDPLGSLIS